MSRKYLAALAVAAALVLAVGLFLRGRFLRSAPPAAAAAPPSQAATFQQLSQEAQFRRMAGYLAERVAAVAARVTYVPAVAAAGVRWGGDTVVVTRPGVPVTAVRVPGPDSLGVPAAIALDAAERDSVGSDWVLVVGRGADGRVVSATGLAGGRDVVRCAGRDVEALVLGVPLTDALAGAGVFNLDGRRLGVVAYCEHGLAALPAGVVTRLLADARGAAGKPGAAYGLEATPLDALARASLGSALGTPRDAAADSGLLVTAVRRGGPADAAGLRAGDLIVAIDGQPTASLPDLGALDGPAPVDGHAVQRRRGRATTLVRVRPPSGPAADSTTPADRPVDTGAAGLGVGLTAPAALRGVPIATVEPGSAAHAAGLRPGDRLLRVGATAVTTATAAERLLAAAARTPTLLVFERDSVERGVVLPSPAPARSPESPR